MFNLKITVFTAGIMALTGAVCFTACTSSKKGNTATTDTTQAAAPATLTDTTGYTYRGVITAIQRGKDGYAATVTRADGSSFTAMMTRLHLQHDYREFKTGDSLQVSGDTLHIQNGVQVQVKKFTAL